MYLGLGLFGLLLIAGPVLAQDNMSPQGSQYQ